MIAVRLKELRREKQSTQKEVSQHTHIAERQYQYYECGRYKPQYEHLIALADYFNVSIDYLVGRSDKKEL
ncbi:MAG: helix-turn-helix transcriptional regulator [Oscillospiraceae bacterium]|nr:helix-turn-helix transcriptional regulator [Oscillospiraceae bacterium]